ncbi:TetR/AcrR family transcriptional regulator [Phenylobacterium sp.]|uniref:TetR/AcrR family transcriptional regulator n=1 Tax=Phenylobacterium sp. TaxID=1871053 RepID=UPI0035B3A795
MKPRTGAFAPGRADRAEAFVPRRGRPTAAQVEAINRSILAAATEHFLSVGFDSASMEAVAAQAGVSKGTLYARFPIKEALLRAVMEARVAAWSAEFGQPDPSSREGLEDRMRRHARVIARAFATEEIRAFEKLVRGPAVAPEIGRAFYGTAIRFALQQLVDDIVEGTKADAVPPRDPQQVAQMLLAMLYGRLHLEEGVHAISEDEAGAYADQAVDLLFAGRCAW